MAVETENRQISESRQAPYRRPIDVPALDRSAIPGAVTNLRRHIYDVALPAGDLRSGQVEALIETIGFMEEGGRVCYVEQVSGYGKTRLMQEIGRGFGGRQVYITPGETASDNLIAQLGGLGIGRVDKEKKEFGHETTVITMQSLNNLYKRVEKGDREAIKQGRFIFGADLIFPDELHHYLTPRGLEILTTFLLYNPKSLMFGATATEGYDAVKNAERQFGKCLHRVTLIEGVEEGVNISPHVRLVKTGASLDDAKISPDGNFILDATVPIIERDKKLLEAYLEACETEGKMLRTLSYLSSVKHAYDFAKLATSMGIPADVVVGETKNRDQIYERLRRGELATVATVATAIESLNLPWIEGTLHSGQTRSMRVARQMFPRSMRNFPGKKPPWIIQAVDERSSYKRRPVLVTDILGETKFLNGSVVVPKRPDKTVSTQGETRSSQGKINLSEGTAISVEVIDINSLFKMGLLDYANLLKQGLLSDQDISNFRNQLRAFLTDSKGKPINVSLYSSARKRIKDDTMSKDVSLSQIISAMYGLSAVSELTSAHTNTFNAFLHMGNSLNIENLAGTRKREEEFTDPIFASFCQRHIDGNLSEDEERALAITIREIIKNQDAILGLSEVRIARVKNDVFAGTIQRLTGLLGFNKGAKNRFTQDSFDSLLEFVNKYSNEEPLVRKIEPNGNAPVIEFSVQGEFRDLCYRFKKGELSEQETRDLALTINDMLKPIMSMNIGYVGLLGLKKIDNSKFVGQISKLTNLLGFNSGVNSNVFSGLARSRLFEFVNEYGDGHLPKLIAPYTLGPTPDKTKKASSVNTQEAGQIKKSFDQIENVRTFLRDVFNQAKMQGFDLNTRYVLGGFYIYDDRFEGTLGTLIARVLGKRNSDIKTADLHKALELAGLEEW